MFALTLKPSKKKELLKVLPFFSLDFEGETFYYNFANRTKFNRTEGKKLNCFKQIKICKLKIKLMLATNLLLFDNYGVFFIKVCYASTQ